MSQAINDELGRMALRYSRQFNVPLQSVVTGIDLDADGHETGTVWAPGLPKWTTGAVVRVATHTSQRSR